MALIGSAGLSILFLALFGSRSFPSTVSEVKFYAVILFVVGFLIIRIKKINHIIMIVGSGILTVGISLLGIPL